MSEAPFRGKSYWEVVVGAFRKNASARVALWVSGTMIAVAALTPLLANDRPFLFHGTMPGEYRRAYNQLTRSAYLQVLALPNRLGEERRKFEERTVTHHEFLRRLTDEETRGIYETLERLRKRAEVRPEIRGRWVSGDVTLLEMLAEMAPEERVPFEASRRRAIRDLPGIYRGLLADLFAGVRKKLSELADQREPSFEARAREIEAKFREAAGADYLTAAEDRRGRLRDVLEELKAAFDPTRVTLVPKTRYPLLDSLDGLDVFLVAATFLALAVFGPLTWWKLGRIAPIERRWVLSWILILAPSATIASLWAAVHEVKFETVSYKKGVQEGSVVMTSALWPPIRYRYDEVPEIAPGKRPPFPPGPTHPLGTDFMGRDLLSRMLWGSRISLSIGFVSTALAVALGVILGVLAGYYRSWVDIALSRFIEWMICFPRFFLVLAVVAFLPPSIYYVMLVLGLFGWMGIARLQRGEFYRLIGQDFVVSARALGASHARTMFRHILPNALAPVLVAASFGVASAMLTESALSFLGFGVQEPATSWGQILYTGRSQVTQGFKEWWTFTIPGAAIFVSVTCYNLVGDGIRDAVDPRLKGTM